MKLVAVLLFAWAAAASAQLPETLTIERSTADAPLGQRATLTVSPLTRRGERFIGKYQMRVSPLPLANEDGSIRITLPADALRKSADHQPVKFQGSATNEAGKPRTVEGVAIPADGKQGAVRMTIHSERGTLRFNTTYRLP